MQVHVVQSAVPSACMDFHSLYGLSSESQIKEIGFHPATLPGEELELRADNTLIANTWVHCFLGLSFHLWETITESELLGSGAVQGCRFPIFPFSTDLTRKTIIVSHSRPLTAHLG